jgi:hypothetical protein
VFYLDVAKVDLDVSYICNGFQMFLGVYGSVSDVYCKCFICFRRPDANTAEELNALRLPAVGIIKGYSKALEYEYRVKIVALGTLK